jgi:hypothetical protein
MPRKPQEPKSERTPAERKPRTRKPRAAAKAEVTQEMIERRAYELYERGTAGDMLAHWLQAEQELS